MHYMSAMHPNRALETSKNSIKTRIAHLEGILDNSRWTTSQKDVGYVPVWVDSMEIHSKCPVLQSHKLVQDGYTSMAPGIADCI